MQTAHRQYHHLAAAAAARRPGRRWPLAFLALALFWAAPAGAFDLPPFDTGHNFSGNPGGPGGGPGGGGGGGDPIILKTGDFFYQTLDWSFHQRGYPLQIVRAYHSDDFYNGPFGFGWHLEILWTLVEVRSATQTLVILRGEGGLRTTFSEEAPGVFTPEPGRFHQLTRQGAGWRVIAPRGLVYDFNAAGWPTRAVRDGWGVNFAYDASGRLATLTSDSGQLLHFEYGPDRRIRRIYDTTGRETRYDYDPDNNLRFYTDRAGHVMEYQYDANHNLLSRKNRRGFSYPINQYDSLRRVTFQRFAEGTLTLQYSPTTNTTTLTDQANRRTTYRYNAGGWPVEITDPSTNKIFYTYDDNYNRTSYTDTSGRTTTYNYDGLGRMTRVRRPDGAETHLNYHPTYGLLTSVTSTQGVSTTFQYDTSGRLAQVGLAGGGFATLAWSGSQLTVSGPAGTSVYTFNDKGRIASAQKDGGPIESYTYDAIGNLVQASRPGLTLNYAYTARDRLAAATENLISATNFFYNEEDSLARVVYPDGREDIFQYDDYNRLRNPLELSGRIELLSLNPTEGVEQEFLSTLGRYVIAEHFDSVWDWGAVLAGLP